MTVRRKIDVNPFNSIASILILVLVFIALFWFATNVFKLLSVIAPFLLIGALLLNHNVVINYGKWLWNLLKQKPIYGIGGILLTFFGFPIISGFLLAKAFLYRKVDKLKQNMEQREQGEFTEYEEVEDEPEIRLELPKFEKPKKSQNSESGYDQFFE